VQLAAGQSGTSEITLSVTDGEGQTATTKFAVSTTPSATNNPPTISSVSNQSITLGQQFPIVAFVVGDTETAAADLKVTGTSSNTALIPTTGLFLGGSGANRSLLLNPAANQTGSSTIVLTVTDAGGKTASTSFVATVNPKSTTKVQNDFNGDGTQDIVLQDASGYLAAWFMSGDDVLSTSFFTPNNVGDAGWKVVGSGDFNGDGKPDLLLQHTDGSMAVWALNGVTLSGSAFTNPSNTGGTSWKAMAVGDFNKDGKADILMQSTDGTLGIWYMDGVNMTSVALIGTNPGKSWAAIGTGDFNADGNLDIILQHTDGTLGVWYLNGTNLLLGTLLNPSTTGDVNWRAVGTIDLNGDGKIDLLLQNRSTLDIGIWYMNGAKLVLGKLINPANPGGTWHVVAP
jgi:hypothetical protein